MSATSHRSREHKRFSPSQAERFLVCPGSVALVERAMAREQSPYARNGEIAHEVLEAGLICEAANATEAINNSIHNHMASNEDIFTVDFKGAINDALDYIFDLRDKINAEHGDCQLFIEQFVNPPSEAAPNETGGMCDVALYSRKARRLWVIDYKHGEGIAKPVVGNVQVKQYGAGFIYGDTPFVDPDNIDVVTLVIIQPRAFHPDGEIREYDVTPAEIFDYLFELDAGIERCLEPNAPLVPGIEQCRFCEARTTCPAYELSGLSAISPDFRSITDVKAGSIAPATSLDLHRLAHVVSKAPMIRKWLESVEEHAKELARSGIDIPGHKLVEVHARRAWYNGEGVEYKTDEQLAEQLASLAKCDPSEFLRKKLISITDAEKLIKHAFKKGVDKNKKKAAAEDAAASMAYFTLRQSSGNLTLVSNDDPRPATSKVQQHFGGIAGLIPPPERTTT